MKTYDDAIDEAVRLLLAYGEQSGPVTQRLYDRLHRDPALQQILLGDALPEDPGEAATVIRTRGPDAVHNLMNRAVNRVRRSHAPK